MVSLMRTCCVRVVRLVGLESIDALWASGAGVLASNPNKKPAMASTTTATERSITAPLVLMETLVQMGSVHKHVVAASVHVAKCATKDVVTVSSLALNKRADQGSFVERGSVWICVLS